MTVHKCVDSGNDALISEVEQESVLLLLEFRQLSLKSLMQGRLP